MPIEPSELCGAGFRAVEARTVLFGDTHPLSCRGSIYRVASRSAHR